MNKRKFEWCYIALGDNGQKITNLKKNSPVISRRFNILGFSKGPPDFYTRKNSKSFELVLISYFF